MKFRANPIDVDAVQFTGKNHDELLTFGGRGGAILRTGPAMCVQTPFGCLHATEGNWIVRTVGPLLVLDDMQFRAMFAAIADETQVHNYTAAKKPYDDAYAMWIASGRRGPAPPRPVKPHIPGPMSLTPEH